MRTTDPARADLILCVSKSRREQMSLLSNSLSLKRPETRVKVHPRCEIKKSIALYRVARESLSKNESADEIERTRLLQQSDSITRAVLSIFVRGFTQRIKGSRRA